MLNISNLKASINQQNILMGVDLTLEKGTVNTLMGPNGSGKSTLAQVIMGNPLYEASFDKLFVGESDISDLSPTERSHAGIFLSFQYPSEIPGVKVSSYLRMIYNNSHETKLSPVKFRESIQPYLDLLEISKEVLSRYLNDGFSGGEKKRMEMLQMLVLEPKLVILDEVDSGLDVDAIKIVSKAVNYLHKEKGSTILLITHYARILKYIKPDKVFIMHKGKIIEEGTMELAHEIEDSGYERFEKSSS